MSAIKGLAISGIKDMTKIRSILCLFLGLAISPLALAHESPLPHDHGIAGSLLLMGALVALGALMTTAYWVAIKRDEE